MIAMKQDTPNEASTQRNAADPTCLAPEELRRVIHGELPVDQFDAAIAHLDECDDCRSAAESIQSSEIDEYGDPLADDLQNETACQAAMLRLMQTPASEYPASIRGFSLEGVLPRETLGPYRILGPLGSGGMSTVLLAQHERLKRRFAIKLLPRERVDHPGWLSRFEREMVAAAALEHTHVVRTTDAGHEDGWHFLVMEYLDGLDVGCIARRIGPLAVRDACEIVRQAALGLAHIHAAGLVHRDIKPSNLMLTRGGIVKVLDLGLVLDGDDPICVDDRLTTVGHLMGTVAFMSPEQLADSRDVDRRADLYSLGATLFRLIAGRSPHERHGGLTKQILAITQNDAPRLDSIREDIDENVVGLVAEMLARDPSERPASADEIASRLEAPATGHRLKKLISTAAKTSDEAGSVWHTTPPASAASGTPPRHRISPWIAGGMFAAFLLAAIVFKIQTDRGELVVHSQLDGLTVNVKQDDELVEQLEVSSDQDNHIVLRKGTYRVEIEGGGEALKLSNEVVTIGRGTTSDLQVIASANQDSGASGAESTELYQGHDLDYWMQAIRYERDISVVVRGMLAVQTLARTSEQQLAAAEATFALTSRWGALGSVAPTSPEQVSSSEDPSHVFMGYLLNVYSRYSIDIVIKSIAHGLHDCNERTLQAASQLIPTALFPQKDSPSWTPSKSAQQWLADSSKHQQRMELLRSIQRSMIDCSASQKVNHPAISGAVYSIQVVLEKPVAGDPLIEPYIARLMKSDISIYHAPIVELGITWVTSGQHGVTWGNVVNQLFSLGSVGGDEEIESMFNQVSEKAPDVLLDDISNRLDKILDASRDGYVGNVGERSGMGGMGGGGSTATFEIANPQNTQWKLSLSFYSRHIEATADSLERLRLIRKAMEEENIQSWFRRLLSVNSSTNVDVYKPIDDAIDELSTRYTAIHGPLPDADMVELNDESSSAAPTDQPVDEQPPAPMFQGHDFDYWMQVLENERDVKTVAVAMTALKVLSLGTETRHQAAVRTLELARRWGRANETTATKTTDTLTDQARSDFYMANLIPIFGDYLPMPGLHAINDELQNGNTKSRGVSVGLLNNYRVAVDTGRQAKHLQRARAIGDIEQLAHDAATGSLLQSLIDQLHDVSQIEVPNEIVGDEKVTTILQDCALWLGLAIDPELTQNDWIASFVKQRLTERFEKWSAKDKSGHPVYPSSHESGYPGGAIENVWGISEDELLAATRLRERDVLSAKYDAYLCSAMMDKWCERYSHRSDEAFGYLAEHASEPLIEQIFQQLGWMRTPMIGEWSQRRGSSPGTLGEIPLGLLADDDSIWKLALPFFAEHVTPDDAALELLAELKKTMKMYVARQNDETSLIPLDAAITRLEVRGTD